MEAIRVVLHYFPLAVYFPLACMSITAQAEIYKWTDASGQVHYSDRAVAGARQLDTDDNPLPVNTTRGLQDFEREQLEDIEREQAARQRAREKQNRAEEKRQQARQEAQQRCRKYSSLVDAYRARLRGGCPAAQCEDYKRRILKYREEMKEVCA